jgi:nucleoside 2-deoxyribosyltransferase
VKIYLAGPDVFVPDALAIGRRKQELCKRHGHFGLFPLDNAVDLASETASLEIFRGNRAMMDDADAIIANLTPFRGPSADAGTVYELGYMAGGNKVCLGYSNDPRPYKDRVAETYGAVQNNAVLLDRQGLIVEDFRLGDNLMIIHSLDLHGCALVTPKIRPSDVWHDLTAFEACLQLATSHRR